MSRDPAGSVPPLPFDLGPYRLESAIGRGGMGIVFEAYDRRLDRRVAIKRLLSGADDPARRQRLRREARTTAQLAHPAVVQVFDLVEDDAGDWIVMERIHGTPLHRVLKAGPLDVDSVLHFGRQIADGLAAAHTLGIVHRDLKTENVMVLPDRRIKILDFGIAKQVGFAVGDDRDLSKTGEVIGTSRAMAPEQARGLGVGPRSDLFSLGVLLYEALSGVSPFRAATPLDTLTRVVSHDPQPLNERVPGLPPDLVDLVDRLLRKAPELRPAGASEVARTFERLIDARRPGPGGDATEPATVAQTVAATAFFVEGAEGTAMGLDEPSQSSDSAFHVRPLPRRTWIVTVALVVLVSAAWLTWEHVESGPDAATGSAAVGGRGSGRGSEDAAHPARVYEETMDSLRRLDPAQPPDHAVAIFRRQLEEDPSSATAHAGLARAYWEKGRNASAGGDPVHIRQSLAVAEEAVLLNPYLVDTRVALGLTLYANGRLDEAAAELKAAQELDPSEADVYYGLGKLAEARKSMDEAVAHYGRAGELRPAPIYFNAAGALLYDLGRYDDAELAFRRTLDVAPRDLHALRNLGAVYYALGRQDEAATMFQAALRVRPDASLYSNLGTLFYSRGLYSKAATAFEDALLQDGAANRYIFWLNLADAYRQLPEREAEAERSYQRGIQILDRLLVSKPTDVRLRSRRALALARSNRPAAAQDDLSMLGSSGTGGDLYSRFRMLLADELLGRRDAALEGLGEILKAGFSRDEVRNEPDLIELRQDPRYHLLLVGLESAP